MRSALIPTVCIVALVAAFITDLLTPQFFVTAILLDAPIVLSSLTRSSRFTYWLVIAALSANITAGYFNGLGDLHHWDSLAIGDRVLAGLSIVFVGYLSTAVQQTAQRAGRLEAQQLRTQRETLLSAAIERVRSSLSLDLVLRAVARETTTLLDADRARFVLSDRANGLTLVARRGADEVGLDESRPSPEAASIVQRALDDGDVIVVSRSDAFGRLLLDHLEAPAALVLPIVDGRRRFGAVLALGRGEHSFADVIGLARAYAQLAAGALAQARLFNELAERNEALEERGAVIRDLVYALSHDLRTPLAALGMTMRQAQSGAYGDLPPAYVGILERSITATDDVGRLAETLLLVARFESGDRRPERDIVDVAELAVQIAGELDALASVHGMRISVDAPRPVFTIGDRDDLRRALTNLAANALQHGFDGASVAIDVKRVEQVVQISVADDGFGVAEAARPTLFTRFARGDGRRGAGSGLGLYIVKRVAAEFGGSVTYAPREPRGSIFLLTLPATSNA